MKKAMIVFAVIALVAVAASPAAAFMGGPRPGGACVSGPADMAQDINLTAEQTEKMNALREAHWKEIKPIKDQIFSKRGDLRILWLAKEPDKEKILNLQKEIQNLRGQLMEKGTNHRFEMRKILTPEQLAKVQSGRGMGWHGSRGWAGMNRKGWDAGADRGYGGPGMRGGQPPCGAGMQRPCGGAGNSYACGGPGMRGGQPPCGAGMQCPCGGAGMNCMSDRAGMGCGHPPCWRMR